jgi:hypothetical protein
MSRGDDRRVRRAFEPNRFSSEQLVQVYEQLKPMEGRTKPAHPAVKTARKKPASIKGGES